MDTAVYFAARGRIAKGGVRSRIENVLFFSAGSDTIDGILDKLEFTELEPGPELAALSISALEQVAVGIVLLNGGDRIVHLNQAAQRLLAGRDGIYVAANRLQASDPVSQRAFQVILARPEGGAAVINRPSGAPPYAVVVAPVQHDDADLVASSSGTRTVFLSDPAWRPQPSDRIMRQLWGLTAAECRVALELLAGMTPSEIAGASHVTEATVRTQMRAIFAKVGVRRQAELVRVLAAICTFVY